MQHAGSRFLLDFPDLVSADFGAPSRESGGASPRHAAAIAACRDIAAESARGAVLVDASPATAVEAVAGARGHARARQVATRAKLSTARRLVDAPRRAAIGEALSAVRCAAFAPGAVAIDEAAPAFNAWRAR